MASFCGTIADNHNNFTCSYIAEEMKKKVDKAELRLWKEKIDIILIDRKKYKDPDYTAQRMAEELGLSPFQLSRLLKKVYGMSYSDIILPLRIKDAKKCLNSPNKSLYTIEEIGILVGFCNKWSFFQTFRKFAGMTPCEWRDSQNNG